jgi:hypothetical protein
MEGVNMRVRQVALSSFKPISVLFEDDFYEIAGFILLYRRASISMATGFRDGQGLTPGVERGLITPSRVIPRI